MDRIRAVAEILGALTIDSGLIPPGTSQDFQQGVLNRLETVLRAHVHDPDGSPDEEDATISVAVDAVGVLRAVGGSTMLSNTRLVNWH